MLGWLRRARWPQLTVGLAIAASLLFAVSVLAFGQSSVPAGTGCNQVFLPIVVNSKALIAGHANPVAAPAPAACPPAPTPTATGSLTSTSTATSTPTVSPNLTATSTSTASPTKTLTPTVTPTATSTNTPTQVVIPPDPASVAPKLDPGISTGLFTATQFLYTGGNPIQTGVAPGTIKLQQVSVLRGKIVDQANAALPGAIVSILGHSEFGQTVSRADGAYDLVVNGGGQLTVNYRKSGFLPAQRSVQAPWQDYVWLPQVGLLPADPNVTAIDVSGSASAVQVARGSTSTDTSGTRRATLLVPPGTTAMLTFADGHTQPVTTLHVRSTEYTIGANGPQAMPAQLPPSSGYTYATEFGADEAAAAGATGVQFGQPVVSYTENFLHFLVGSKVPSGSYDRVNGNWVAGPNGLVVKILSVTGGAADLDVDGSGLPGTAKYAALGITLAERQQLANPNPGYTINQSLWRVPLNHFSPWDFNWPWGPPFGPGTTPPKQKSPTPPVPPCKPCQEAQGRDPIEAQNQAFGYDAPITGTSFRLHYQSNRLVGGTNQNQITIPLTDSAPPANLQGITLNVQVAGQQFSLAFTNAPSQSYPFTWNGKDAYGRTVQGEQPITAQIGYTYPGVYLTASQQANIAASTPDFGHFTYDGAPATADPARMTVTLWQNWQGTIGKWQAPIQELGGWSLDVHHAYDPAERVVYLGNGGVQSAQTTAPTIKTTAGTGASHSCFPQSPLCGDGGPATNAPMSPWSVAVAPDGSQYVADWNEPAIRKIDPSGTLSTFVGTGVACGQTDNCGDGGPANLAQVARPLGLAFGPDGSLYIADYFRVRRVNPAGTISTIAGTGAICPTLPCGDGGPALNATFGALDGLAVGLDGSIFVADTSNSRVRRIDTNGIITTVAGGGPACNSQTSCGDGGPAAQATLNSPSGLAVGPRGDLYIADTGIARVRKVGLDGIINVVAGNTINPYCFINTDPCGDGGPATQASLYDPTGIAVGADGTVYFYDDVLKRARKVDPSGIITTIAGNGIQCAYGTACGDGGPAAQSQLSSSNSAGAPLLALGPDGSLFLADVGSDRVRKVAPPLPGVSASNYVIPSEDGKEVFVFDNLGRHLQTLNSVTGTTIYTFGYDAGGRLSTITDFNGQVTTVQRDVSGNPLAIHAPFGQTTSLTRDASGYLKSIADPGGNTTQLISLSSGLISTITDPNGKATNYLYDGSGRLTSAQDPAGGGVTLNRVDSGTSYTVTLTTTMGRATLYAVQSSADGSVSETNTDPAGAVSTQQAGVNGSYQIGTADGTTQVYTQGPDPRFGPQVSQPLSVVDTSHPGNVTNSVSYSRSVTLSNPTNPLSLTSQTDQVSLNGGGSATSVYTAAGRTYTNTSPTGRASSATLDSLSRITSMQIDPSVTPIALTYDGHGNLATMGQGNESLTYAYDANNRMTSETDAASHQTGYGYDSADRLTSLTLPNGETFQFGRDSVGNTTSVTMPSGASHTFTYDAVGNTLSYVPPTVTPSSTPLAYQYAYNADHQRTLLTLPSGRAVNYTYDSGGRPTGSTYPEATVVIGYGDATDRPNQIARNPSGGGTGQAIAYTSDGQMPTGQTWTGLVSGAFAYSYDPNGYLHQNTLTIAATPITTTFGYDADGLLTSDGAFTFTRNGPKGSVSAIADTKLTTTLTYDSLGRVSGQTTTANGVAVYSSSLGYDNAGRLTTKTETINGVLHTYGYTYDKDSQLTGVTRDSEVSEQYLYDLNGNRTSVLAPAFATVTPVAATFDAQDRLMQLAGTNYIFGPDGNLTTRNGADTFTFSARGELLSATVSGQTVTYGYDGLGRRVSRTLLGNTTKYLYGNPYDPSLLTASVDSANVVTVYHYDDDGALFALSRGGAWYYVATDQIGTPRAIADATGTILKTIDEDSFGNVLVVGGTTPSFDLPIGFAGGLTDPTTGLVRFGVRDYDPRTSRWTTKDRLILAGGDSNLYRYALNNPLQSEDRLGLAPTKVRINFHYKSGGWALSWLGHTSITVNGQSYGFYPAGPLGASNFLDGVPAPGRIGPDSAPTYSDEITVPQWRADAMQQFLEAEKARKDLKWSFLKNNCQDKVRQALKAGGIDLPYFTPSNYELQYWLVVLEQAGKATYIPGQ